MAPQTSQTAVPVRYNAAQSAGNLNVVIVGWNDANGHLVSVSDTSQNSYKLAVGPTQGIGPLSQSIYYAPNIAPAAAAANTVTVTFSPAAAYPDVRVLEYSGVDPVNAVDVIAAGNGSSTTSNSGNVTTKNVANLLVGANMVQGVTSGPGTSFTMRLLTVPNADIAQDRVVTTIGSYSATAPVPSGGGWVMQMVAFRAANSPPPPPPDTTPPTVSITDPQAGQTVTGTINVAVAATDASGVASVRLQIDGFQLAAIDTTSPYTFSLNTAAFANGLHTLTASAVDGLNNAGTSNPVSVFFSNSNPGNPAQFGMWSGTIPVSIMPVHSALLPNGKIFMSDAQSAGADAIVWDPATYSSASVTAPANIFCNGMEQMADGRLLIVGGHAGGHIGLTFAGIFNPSSNSWTSVPNMAYPRWYPTATMLPNGRILVTSGESNCDGCYVPVQEIYNPSTNSWTQLSSAPFSFAYYPHLFVLPDGRVLVPATAEAPIVSQVLDLNTLTWTSIGGPTAVDGGSSVMYLPGKVLKVGTSVDPDKAIRSSAATAYVLDMTTSTPAWRQVLSMNFPRTYMTTTLLPDGTVLVTGGGPTTNAVGVTNAIRAAELWSPATESFTTLGSMNAPRLYHSEALLLPDARVLVMGGGRFNGLNEPTDQQTVEFFAPPYLFKGQQPVITSAPSQLSYGQIFTVQTPDAVNIGAVSLIRFGSVTHAIDMGQRFVPLTFTIGSGSATSLGVVAPSNANIAPPGNYMLFIIDLNGVPSKAAIVHF